MVTDKQVRRMMQMVETGKTKEMASLQTGMDRKTARKYLEIGGLPSEVNRSSCPLKNKCAISVV